MSKEKIMNGQVPKAPIFAHILAVPPIFVELSISEVEKLADDIQKAMEIQKEENDPAIRVRNSELQELVDVIIEVLVIRIPVL